MAKKPTVIQMTFHPYRILGRVLYIPEINDDRQHADLPLWALYIAPDGTVRTKTLVKFDTQGSDALSVKWTDSDYGNLT